MKTNLKFLSLMATLTEEEVSGFWKYLQLHYPNEGNALKVFRYYKRFFPHRQNPVKMALPFAYRKIYTSETTPGIAEQKKIWNAFSKLYLWLKEYLVLEKMRSDRFVSDMLWLNVLQEKKLNSEYGKEAIKCHESNYYELFDVAACLKEITLELHFKEQLTMHAHKLDNAMFQACLWRMEKAADLIRLKVECDRITLYKVMSHPPSAPEDKPLMKIYKKIHALLTTEDPEHYFDLEKLVYQYAAAISPSDLNSILRYMQNFTGWMARRGPDTIAWAVRYHGLNKSMLAKDVVASQKNMTAAHFQNIVNFACVAADFEWVHQFIADYTPYLPQKIRDENLSIAEATIAFEQKDYKRVVALTQKPVFKDERHIIRLKLLRLRALYELDLDLTDEITSFKTYLQRSRGKESISKESSLSFLKLLNMLFQKNVSKEELVKTFEQSPAMLSRPWIKEKIGKYKQGAWTM